MRLFLVQKGECLTTVGTQNEKTRVAWLEKILQKIPAGSRVLDAGAGEQKYRCFCSHLDYVAQDFAQYDGIGNACGLQTGVWDQSKLDITSDIIAIPESDNSFDCIMCIEVLEHLPEPLAAVKEFYRLLRPGGKLIITAPFCSLTHFAPYHFYSGFNRYFYETNLPVCGFEIEELAENGNYFECIAQEIRRIQSVALRYAQARPTFFQSIALKSVLKMLARFSDQDRRSSELLHFGCQIVATKK